MLVSLTKQIRANRKRPSWSGSCILDVVVRQNLTVVLRLSKLMESCEEYTMWYQPPGFVSSRHWAEFSCALKKFNTVKIGLTITSKRLPLHQDDRFWLFLIFLVRDTSIKQYMWPWPPPIWTKIYQNVTKEDHVSFVWLVLPCQQNIFGYIGKILYKEHLKCTTYIGWPLYIGPQGGSLKKLWLYIKIMHPVININILINSFISAIL